MSSQETVDNGPALLLNTPYLEPGHYKNSVILCSGGYDHSIRYWNAEKGFCERIVQQTDNSHINALSITPNREILASAGFQHIRLYDIESGNQNPLVNFEGLTKNVCTVGFNHRGNWLYTGGEDGFVRIWDVRNRALHCQRQRQFQTPVNSAFLHPNGVEIYVADQSGSIYIWNLHSDQLHRLFVTNDGYVQSIAYDKDSRLLAAVDTRGNCYVFRNTAQFYPKTMDEKSGEMTMSGFLQRRLMFQAHSKYVLKCAFSPDSTLLATSSGDQTVKLWSTSDFSVANPTSFVQFDDPYEAVTNDATGPASMGSSSSGSSGTTTTTTFKNAYSTFDTDAIENLDHSFSASNPSAAFLNTPYLVGLFSHQIQPPRPPPCYLKPKQLCAKCIAAKSGTAAGDTRMPQGTSSPAATVSPSEPTAGGRSMYHSPGCKQAISRSDNAMGGIIPMQPTLNSLNQLTWNFYGMKSPGKKLSDPGVCNHHSHFRSPTHRASVPSYLPGDPKSPLSGSPSKCATSQPSSLAASSNGHFAPARRLPQYAARFFDNKYYELHSGMVNTDSEEEEGESQLCTETRERKRLERAERKAAKKSAEVQEAEEDEEFYRLIKKMQLVVSSDDDEDDEEEDEEEEDAGLQMLSDFVGRSPVPKKVKPEKPRCCVGCGTCYCLANASSDTDKNDSTAGSGGGRTRHPSGNPNATGSQPTGGKNEWMFTNAITPRLTLNANNQRWVWDLAFSADSQYIFTASSDQYVRLWSVFTGELTREYSGHQKSVTALAFSDLVKD